MRITWLGRDERPDLPTGPGTIGADVDDYENIRVRWGNLWTTLPARLIEPDAGDRQRYTPEQSATLLIAAAGDLWRTLRIVAKSPEDAAAWVLASANVQMLDALWLIADGVPENRGRVAEAARVLIDAANARTGPVITNPTVLL